jgi:hypothetical protein
VAVGEQLVGIGGIVASIEVLVFHVEDEAPIVPLQINVWSRSVTELIPRRICIEVSDLTDRTRGIRLGFGASSILVC